MRIIFSPEIGNILGYDAKEDVMNVFGPTNSVITLHNTYNTGGELSVTLCVL